MNNHYALTTYYRCSSCRKITRGDEKGPALCCPSADAPVLWPSLPVYRLLETACSQDLSSPVKASVAAVFFSAAADLLVEMSVMELGRHVDARFLETLVGQRRHVMLGHLYAKVRGDALDRLLEAAGIGGFIENLGKLYGLRSRMLNDPHYPVTDDDRQVLAYTGSHLLAAFIRMHQSAGAAPAPRTVLVVEDEAPVLQFMLKAIERQGLKAIGAENGKKALTLFKEHRPACVFLDVSLPDADGVSILKEIKKVAPAVKVYMATGVSGDTFTREIRQFGADGHLLKPVDAQALLPLLKAL